MKKKITIILGTISVLSIILLLYLQNQNVKNLPDFVPTKYIDVNEITIGSNKEAIETQIGKEITSTSSGDLLISDYKSKNIYRPHQIYYKDNNSVLIIEEITDKSVTTDNMREKYGSATNILYEKLEHSAFNLFVYLDKGVAYLGHKNGGLVLEIWYFKSTNNINTFIKTYANSYQETPFTEQSKY